MTEPTDPTTAADDSRMVDATPSRDRVKQLVADGMTQEAIADAAGVSMSAISILLHGQYSPGRPTRQAIKRGVERRILAVEFQPRAVVHRAAEPWCASTAEFEPAGYRVGRCLRCGETTWARTTNTFGDEVRLIAHPTRIAERTAA
jgi:transcriptional regulator with XRE-family HTH domain